MGRAQEEENRSGSICEEDGEDAGQAHEEAAHLSHWVVMQRLLLCMCERLKTSSQPVAQEITGSLLCLAHDHVRSCFKTCVFSLSQATCLENPLIRGCHPPQTWQYDHLHQPEAYQKP